MNEKQLFPDYEPKTTPDTIYDYLRKPDSFVHKILEEIGQPSLEKLKLIVDYFHRYKKAADMNPGGYEEGNIAIGASQDQYYPSEEEILVSELGKVIKDIITSYSKKQIEKIKQKEKVLSQAIMFNEIIFRHVDVMGSGRFFYAEKKKPKVELKL
ncbi:MAG: hypothetical protein ACFE9Q_02200 [Candidatus Hodarchaeota archaeon]